MCSSLSNTVAGLQACNFIKKRLQCRCFPANIAKFLRTCFEKYLRPTADSAFSQALRLCFISHTLSSPVCIPSRDLERLLIDCNKTEEGFAYFRNAMTKYKLKQIFSTSFRIN